MINHLIKQLVIKNSFSFARSPFQNSLKYFKFSSNFIRQSSKMSRYEYPKVRRDMTVIENFHGNEV